MKLCVFVKKLVFSPVRAMTNPTITIAQITHRIMICFLLNIIFSTVQKLLSGVVGVCPSAVMCVFFLGGRRGQVLSRIVHKCFFG